MMVSDDFNFNETFSRDNFLFGVANAPYLSEGGFNSPDGIKNNFAILERDGKIQRTGKSTDFWHNYEEHIRLAASLDLNAFRMGFAWSRIQPTSSYKPHKPPEWDFEAVRHYSNIIKTLFKFDLEPIITLHHFCHPAWLPLDMWLYTEGPEAFIKYTIFIVEEINSILKKDNFPAINHFIVYNEPNLVPLSHFMTETFPINKRGPKYVINAYDNMFSSYVKIYDRLYDLFQKKNWGDPHIGFNMASKCAYELDKMFFDIIRLKSFNIQKEGIKEYIHTSRENWDAKISQLAKRKLSKSQFKCYKRHIKLTKSFLKPSSFNRTISEIYGSKRDSKLDYISVNIYEPFDLIDPENMPKWWEFRADYEIYETFIKAYNQNNSNLPIYMGENSLAYKQAIGKTAQPRPDGWTRQRYLKTYFSKMIECIDTGIPIKGYLYWSLLDDYEWESYEPRLGLYNYDYENQLIKARDGLGEPAGEIYANLINTLREGDRKEILNTFNLE